MTQFEQKTRKIQSILDNYEVIMKKAIDAYQHNDVMAQDKTVLYDMLTKHYKAIRTINEHIDDLLQKDKRAEWIIAENLEFALWVNLRYFYLYYKVDNGDKKSIDKRIQDFNEIEVIICSENPINENKKNNITDNIKRIWSDIYERSVKKSTDLDQQTIRSHKNNALYRTIHDYQSFKDYNAGIKINHTPYEAYIFMLKKLVIPTNIIIRVSQWIMDDMGVKNNPIPKLLRELRQLKI